MTKTIRVPSPAPGTGYRVIRGTDGRMTTVPLTGADMALYRPMMAMDEAGPPPREDLSKAAWGSGDDIDLDTPDSSGDDLEDKIRQLLEGKLDDADLAALIQLIQPDEDAPAPAPAAQDRKRGGRQARDQRLTMPSKAEVLRRIAAAGEVRAARALKSHAALIQRFPALKNARVA